MWKYLILARPFNNKWRRKKPVEEDPKKKGQPKKEDKKEVKK